MKRLEPLGIWEAFVPGVQEGCLYKYYILTEKGQELYKADPFAAPPSFVPEMPPRWRISANSAGQTIPG